MTASEVSIPGCSQGLQSIGVLALAGQFLYFRTDVVEFRELVVESASCASPTAKRAVAAAW